METSTTKIKIDTSAFLSGLLNLTASKGAHLAVWRQPEDQQLLAVLQLEEELNPGPFTSHSAPAGFMVSPFENEGLQSSYFIKGDLLLTLELSTNYVEVTNASGVSSDLIEETLEALKSNPHSNIPYSINSETFTPGNLRQTFIENVEDAIEQISAGKFKKLVFSRTKSIELEHAVNLSETVIRLLEVHSSHFVSLISSPAFGTWLGSSPEILVSLDHEQEVFKTVSLAGTQENLHGDPKEAAWRQKEIEEQALVSRFIINCFKKIRLREFEEIGPKTVIAGNLMHLKSEFIVRMKDINFPELGDVMLELLHPTSAVSGMPKQEAQKHVVAKEKHQRHLYAGFLGPININQRTELFVNLRCACIHEQGVTLFAGAGITEDSEPDKEWRETALKCETLARHIVTN